jgi:hypothetical protein
MNLGLESSKSEVEHTVDVTNRTVPFHHGPSEIFNQRDLLPPCRGSKPAALERARGCHLLFPTVNSAVGGVSLPDTEELTLRTKVLSPRSPMREHEREPTQLQLPLPSVPRLKLAKMGDG